MDVIETDRLVLRAWTRADAPRLLDIMGRPEVARWSGAGVPIASLQEAVERIERQPERAGPRPETGVFAAERKVDRVIAGTAMLVPIPASRGVERDDTELGWHFHPDSWGHGFATEAASALRERAFAAGLVEVYAVTKPDNVRSQAVCARLGMDDLGLRDDWYDTTVRAFRSRSASPRGGGTGG